MNLIIFGAQGYALGAYKALRTLCPRQVIPCFLVSSMGGNASRLGEIPVKVIGTFAEELSEREKQNTQILIATPESVQAEIEETLENYGFHHYRGLDSEYWAEMMKMYHIKLGKYLPLSVLPVGFREPFIRVYLARSHMDKPLKNGFIFPPYAFPIQVGTDCCEERIAEIKDNTGNNISGKNGNYCELTALYWIWKQKLTAPETSGGESRQYFGLGHYRRMLQLGQDDLLRLVDNEVDVVLPYPLLYEPDINAHRRRYIKEEDWEALLQALNELQPLYASALPGILSQQYLYNFNIVLARKSVLKEYCEWLFPILERVEQLSIPKGCDRKDRYLGYMGETLETLYFMKNAGKYNIVHTECKLFL